jgi:hypothetical protein
MRDIYLLQPYYVGTKKYKSLALCLPAEVVREAKISPSTGFALRIDTLTKKVKLDSIDTFDFEKYLASTSASMSGGG